MRKIFDQFNEIFVTQHSRSFRLILITRHLSLINRSLGHIILIIDCKLADLSCVSNYTSKHVCPTELISLRGFSSQMHESCLRAVYRQLHSRLLQSHTSSIFSCLNTFSIRDNYFIPDLSSAPTVFIACEKNLFWTSPQVRSGSF